MKSDRPLKLLDMDKIISLSQTQNAPYPGVVVNSNPCVVNSQ